MLKLWGRANSINVQKVTWLIGELGLPHERIDAGMAFGVVGEDFYGALNPNRLIPTIEDDGLVLWESNAIVRYLAGKHGLDSICPKEPSRRAEADMWMDWQATTINPGLGPIFIGLIRTPPEKRDAAAIARGVDQVAKAFALLDRHLAGRAHLLGEAFTMADIPLGCAVYRWYALPIERPDYPHLRAWYERLAERPAYRRHVMLPLT